MPGDRGDKDLGLGIPTEHRAPDLPDLGNLRTRATERETQPRPLALQTGGHEHNV
jgi:hypothetical protein